MSAERPVVRDAAEGLRGGLRVESGQLPGRLQPEAIINRVVAGDSPQRFRGGAGAEFGQLPGRLQPEAIINRVVAGDSPEEFGRGAGVVSGQLFGRGHAVVIGVVIHGSGAFLCERSSMRIPLAAFTRRL
jgi:hypothetical protein